MNTSSIGTIFHTPATIAFAGDWHANTAWAVRAVRHAKDNGASVIIHTGDFGYDYTTEFALVLEEALAEAGILLLFVRGNHDDPDFLDNLDGNDLGFKPVTSHIWYIPQGKSWTWDGVRFLGLGGAHSIDRLFRVEGVSWWARETISTVDAFKAAHQGEVDVMITHDCPAGVTIPGLDKPSGWDARELALSHRHRERLYEVVLKVKPRLLVHGHYHTRYTGFLDIGAAVQTRVVGLDCDNRDMAANIAFSAMSYFKEGNFYAFS